MLRQYFYAIYLYVVRLFKRTNVTERRIYITPSENTNDFRMIESPIHNDRKIINNFENYLTTPSPPIKNRKRITNECCICLEPLNSKKNIYLNTCKHEIHVHCIKEWFKVNVDCPLCRSNQTKLKARIAPSSHS